MKNEAILTRLFALNDCACKKEDQAEGIALQRTSEFAMLMAASVFLLLGGILAIFDLGNPDIKVVRRYQVTQVQANVIDTKQSRGRYSVWACWKMDSSGVEKQICGDPTACGVSFYSRNSAESLATVVRSQSQGMIVSGKSQQYLLACNRNESDHKNSRLLGFALIFVAGYGSVVAGSRLYKHRKQKPGNQ